MRLLTTIFGRSCAGHDGLVECTYDTGPDTPQNRVQRWPLGELDRCAREAAQISNQGSKVYFGAGVRDAHTDYTHPKYPQFERHSRNADIVSWPALVWDFDNEEAAQLGLERARQVGLSFQLVVQTGALKDGGKPDLRIQAWALLDTPCTDMAKVSRALKAGIRLLGSDKSIHDAHRLVRLAGSVAWARKDGRVDELTLIRDDLATFRVPYSIDEIIALLEAHAPAPDMRMQSDLKSETIPLPEVVGSIWRDSPAVREAQADLLAGVEMNPSMFRLALAAARDGHQAPQIKAGLLGLLEASDGQVSRPERVRALLKDLDRLVREAVADAGVPKSLAPYQPAAVDFAGAPADETPLDCREQMFRDFVWCGRYGTAIEVATGEQYDRLRLDTKCYEVGDAGTRNSAWTVFTKRGDLRRDVEGLTFLPGGGRLVELLEPQDGMPAGWYVNEWFEPDAPLRRDVGDEEVGPFLALASVVIPEAGERETILKWMRWVAQNPHLKPNWAVVLGSTVQGIGKDTFLDPLRVACQRRYTREITAADLLDTNNGSYLTRTKLLIVEEMENFEKRQTETILKPLIAAPPWTLRAKEKWEKARSVPNLFACIFMTNNLDSLRIAPGDRRYMVSWNRNDVEPEAFYAEIRRWYASGGLQLAAGWLLSKDVGDFNAGGRAPDTQAKHDMRRATTNPVLEWIEDCIAERAPPFHIDIVPFERVRMAIPDEVVDRRHGRPGPQLLRRFMEQARCRNLGRTREGGGFASYWSCRDHVRYAELSASAARDLSAQQLARTEAEQPLLAA